MESHGLSWRHTVTKDSDTKPGFGSGYYSSDLSGWLRVDPLASIYPMLSPYAYVANNHIMYYNPDGKIIALVVTSMANREFDNISRDTKNWTVIRDAKQPQIPSNIELPKEPLILGSEGYGH